MTPSAVHRPSRAARLVSEVLAPANLALVLPPVVGWHATRPDPAGLAWGLFTSLACGLLPLVYVLYGCRRRWWDWAGARRRSRQPAILGTGVSVLFGTVVLAVAEAPPVLSALGVGLLVGLLAVGAITARWKISLHTSIAAGAATVLVLLFGVAAWWTAPPVLLVGWARLRLRAHSLGQVVAGALLGGGVAVGIVGMGG
ncbi:hypothetical protein [Allostreptomyces psammosilenae]|uniref:Membrane-associated phospholipid phosphatase n=1 Tax=Allostreptomyces psammosilenae TaxID=1892865 RepID=A0A852ZZH8_9ACTN|nr:hypothetical protein [Allostreptomyces psammosilenae]NYI03528.1 membrane-associated phospholipid phosphatase [Allostreptomyces psammosilenae]